MYAGSRTNQKPYAGQITEIGLTCAPFYEIPSNINTMAVDGMGRGCAIYLQVTFLHEYLHHGNNIRWSLRT